ncbi:MAG: hypothetical protein U5N10_08400 [Gemmobacter sp.]|nr:hypothetical protein [Gemmobacter sp.]
MGLGGSWRLVLVAGTSWAMPAGLMGAGDAKFAAAMAGVFVTADLQYALKIIASSMVAALVTQKLACVPSPPSAASAPGWESWGRQRFPLWAGVGCDAVIFHASRLAAFLAK